MPNRTGVRPSINERRSAHVVNAYAPPPVLAGSGDAWPRNENATSCPVASLPATETAGAVSI